MTSTSTVTVAGVGMTEFRRSTDDPLRDLMESAATRALDDAGVDPGTLTSVHVGNMAAEGFNGRSGLHNLLASSLGAFGAHAERIENTSASGASAFLRGVEAVASGRSDRALVVGVEKMSEADTETATGIIGSIVHEREYAQGLTLPSFAGLAADAYLRRYDADADALAAVAVKNHANAVDNPYAQFRTEITIEEARESPPIASPLRLFDCSPMGDGAAAVVLTAGDASDGAPPERSASSEHERPVRVRSSASAVGTHAVAERADPLRIASVERAGEAAFERAGREPADVDVACIHDAFTILELLELEELGFYDAGEAWRATLDGETARDGPLPVNPGGGLKARGHPLGATGVSQIVELVWQLRGDAGPRQVDGVRTGLAVNVAGFGNNAVCSVLEADE